MKIFRCFLNDDDGLSITDTLAIFFSLIYLVIIAVMMYCLIENKLTENHLDFMQISTWPALTILGGYFGDRIFSNFGTLGRKQRRIITPTVANSSETEAASEYNEDTGPL